MVPPIDEDTAKNIVDGENNGSEARSGIFNARRSLQMALVRT